MSPLLSIIVPVYNHKEHLPSLFANLVGQKFTDFEVVLVDDCSDETFDDVVELWKEKGLDIHLYKNSTRQYTKNSRLNGVEHSRGDLIMFMDADDTLAGTSALRYHVALMQEKAVDILQFSIMNHYIDGSKKDEISEWSKPFSESLAGGQIFETYVAEGLRGHLVYGKIIRRSLLEHCLPAARASSVRRYREDLMLVTLLYFHAKSYWPSDRVGYIYLWENKEAKKTVGRVAASYFMLTELLPHLRENGASALAIQGTESFLLREMYRNANFMKKQCLERYGYGVPDTVIKEIEEHCTVQIFVKALLACP